MANIVIDLTPLLPSGENGGAKPVVISLIKYLSKIAQKDNFILLTANSSHQELSILDTHNVRRICVLGKKDRSTIISKVGRRIKNKLFAHFRKTFLEKLKADLLFCPFTEPFFAAINIPVISVIYDLQYADCPYFFSPHDQHSRNISFQNACQTASYLICISEFTRQSVLKHSTIALSDEKVITVPIYIPHENTQLNISMAQILESYNLQNEKFLLYPANFWKHKNHKLLITAFAMYCKQYPHSTLKLVCTGFTNENQKNLVVAVEKMGLSERIIFPGYVPSTVLYGLLFSCRALIFPSLYEGFGIPIVEAMLAGKPVLSSNKGSLPEIGKNRVFYFDPTKLKQIFSAIYEVEQHLDKFYSQVILAYEFARQYLGVEKMAATYYKIFQEAIQKEAPKSNTLFGVFEDGWTSNNVILSYVASKEKRLVEIMLSSPDWHPIRRVSLILRDSHAPKNKKKFLIKKGESLTIRYPLQHHYGQLTLLIKDLFQPAQWGIGNDKRMLGCYFHEYKVISAEETTE